MVNYFYALSDIEKLFLIIGFVGQGLFASRFIVQWFLSERKKTSYIPLSFWYLSIFGGMGLLIYAIFRKDPVIIICKSGRRSRVVANYLVQKENHLTVFHATNGIKSWIESNKKIVKPE